MEVNNIINLIQTLGFPIFVVLWFMWRTEKVITANTEAIYKSAEILKSNAQILGQLVHVIEKLSDKMDVE